MKRWFLVGLGLWFALGTNVVESKSPTPRPAARKPKPRTTNKGTLIVRITGFRSSKGRALIAMFGSAKGFPGKHKNAVLRQVTAIKNKVAVFKLKKLKFGTYAISAIHDANNNQKLDTGIFGIPKEAYGASRNARRTFGPPRFRDAKFVFKKHKQVVTFYVK